MAKHAARPHSTHSHAEVPKKKNREIEPPEALESPPSGPTRWPSIVSLDEEMRTPTPREKHIAELTKQNSGIAPQRYDIKNKNAHAMRVIYNHEDRAISIPPGETKFKVLLRPNTAAQLNQTGDL